MSRRTGKVVTVALIALAIIVGIAAAILGVVSLLSTGSESLSVLLQKKADVVETARSRLPIRRSARSPPIRTNSKRRWQRGCESMPRSCAQ